MLIYILTNPCLPGLCKVGITDDIDSRLKRLNKAEVIPAPFEVYATCETGPDMSDKTLLTMLDTLGHIQPIEDYDGKKRSDHFFENDPNEILDVLRIVASFAGTADKITVLGVKDEPQPEKSFARRRNWGFFDYGLKAGDAIDYVGPGSEENPRKLFVLDNKTVSDGETSGTLTSFGKLFSNTTTTCTMLFAVNGETLWDIRKRLENDESDDEIPDELTDTLEAYNEA